MQTYTTGYRTEALKAIQAALDTTDIGQHISRKVLAQALTDGLSLEDARQQLKTFLFVAVALENPGIMAMLTAQK